MDCVEHFFREKDAPVTPAGRQVASDRLGSSGVFPFVQARPRHTDANSLSHRYIVIVFRPRRRFCSPLHSSKFLTNYFVFVFSSSRSVTLVGNGAQSATLTAIITNTYLVLASPVNVFVAIIAGVALVACINIKFLPQAISFHPRRVFRQFWMVIYLKIVPPPGGPEHEVYKFPTKDGKVKEVKL
jgi:hypothetical protein